MIKLTVRQANSQDAQALYDAIRVSTGNKTNLSIESLSSNLAVPYGKHREVLKCDQPIIRSLIAELNESFVGYLIFYYHYTPWVGHSAFIADLYTTDCFERNEIATQLLYNLIKICRNEKLKGMYMNMDRSRMDSNQIEWIEQLLDKFEFKVGRDDSTDWSVFELYL